MEGAGISALLLTNAENVRYFSGLLSQPSVPSMYDDVRMCLIASDPSSDPVLFVGDQLGGIANTSWIDDVRVWSQWTTGEGKTPAQQLAEALHEKKLHRGRIAMEIGRSMPLAMPMATYQAFREALPHVEVVDSADIVSSIRRIKSEEELRYMRKACEITCRAFVAGLESLREGMSERELSHIMAEEALGHTDEGGISRQWVFFINGGRGRMNWFDGIPSDYRFQKGDAIMIDGGVSFRGYWCDMLRTASIGELDDDYLRIFTGNRLANIASMKSVAPGVPISELSRAAFDTWRANGLAKELEEQLTADYDFMGHGIGQAPNEEPLLCSTNRDELQAGMVFALEGMLVDRMPLDKTRIAVGIEEDVLVTENGYELLTPIVNHLWVK